MKNRFKIFRKKYARFLPFLVIILLPLGLFPTAFIGQDLILLGDFTGSDLLDLHLPLRTAVAQAFRRLTLPLWQTDLSLGFPLLAEGQSGPFYPLHLLFTFLPPYLSLNWSIISTFIIAGLGTYLYSRRLRLTGFSSLIAALIMMFAAFFVVRAKHVNMVEVAAWIPFLFYGTKRLFENRNLFWAVFLGLILALQFLAGHPQMTFFSFFGFFFYFLFEAYQSGRKQGFSAVFPLALLAFCLIVLLGLALSAVQILPTLELIGQSERLQWTLYSATNYPFHPKNLMTFISPYYFGNPATGTYREDITQTGIFWENCAYLGLLPLGLALWVLIRTLLKLGKKRKKTSLPDPDSFLTPYFLFFGFLTVFSLLLVLGRFTPLFGFLWQNFPGFAFFRLPTRFNFFIIFSFAILAGFGSQKLADKLENLQFQPQKTTSGEAGAAEEEFRLAWPFRGWQTQAIILGLILLDLFVFAQNYLGKIKADWYLKEPESVKVFQEEKELFRLWGVTQYGQSPYQLLGWKKFPEPLVALRQALPPNQNLVYHLPAFSDRGWFEGGLSSRKRNRLEKWLLEENQDEIMTGKILGIFNVKYILTFSPAGGFEMTEKASFDLGKEFGLPLKIYENQQIMPRFYFVPEAIVIPDEEAVIPYLTNSQFLPTKTVILSKEPRQIPPAFAGTLDDFQKDNPLVLKKYAPTEVVIEAKIGNHGFLILSDLDYPGWKVNVDGQEKEILPANLLVRAVELTPGKHQIRFFYDPLSFKIGAAVSGVTLFGLLGTVLFYRRKFSIF